MAKRKQVELVGGPRDGELLCVSIDARQLRFPAKLPANDFVNTGVVGERVEKRVLPVFLYVRRESDRGKMDFVGKQEL